MNNFFDKFVFFVLSVFLVFAFLSCSGTENEEVIEEVGLFDFTGDVNYVSNDHTEISAAKNQYTSSGKTLEKDWYKNLHFIIFG